eukprot:1873800-Amphidinium_carterae.1
MLNVSTVTGKCKGCVGPSTLFTLHGRFATFYRGVGDHTVAPTHLVPTVMITLQTSQSDVSALRAGTSR